MTKLIEALPSKITMSNFQKVITAYAAYNGLNSTQKAVISKTNKDKLLKAYAEAQDVEVKYVEGLISKIGKVTLSSEEKITDAKTAYNSLSSAQKKKVTNYSVLTAAEKALQQLKKAAEPTPTTKPSGPSGKPGSKVNLVTPKPTATPGAANPVQNKICRRFHQISNCRKRQQILFQNRKQQIFRQEEHCKYQKSKFQ